MYYSKPSNRAINNRFALKACDEFQMDLVRVICFMAIARFGATADCINCKWAPRPCPRNNTIKYGQTGKCYENEQGARSCLTPSSVCNDPCVDVNCGFNKACKFPVMVEGECCSVCPETDGGDAEVLSTLVHKYGWPTSLANGCKDLRCWPNGRIRFFGLSRVAIDGELPWELGLLSRLERLIIDQTALGGSIPPHIGNLSSMNYLALNSNNLAGSIPFELFANMPELTKVDLSDNQLTGTIPDDWNGAPKLKYLDMSQNRLTGPIPSQLATLPETLVSFKLNRNILQGPVLNFTQTCLITLQLQDNRLSGPIPTRFGLLEMSSIMLHNNLLCGPVPAALGQMWSHTVISVHCNLLVGPMPRALRKHSSFHKLKACPQQSQTQDATVTKCDLCVSGATPDVWLPHFSVKDCTPSQSGGVIACGAMSSESACIGLSLAVGHCVWCSSPGESWHSCHYQADCMLKMDDGVFLYIGDVCHSYEPPPESPCDTSNLCTTAATSLPTTTTRATTSSTTGRLMSTTLASTMPSATTMIPLTTSTSALSQVAVATTASSKTTVATIVTSPTQSPTASLTTATEQVVTVATTVTSPTESPLSVSKSTAPQTSNDEMHAASSTAGDWVSFGVMIMIQFYFACWW